MGCGVCGIQSLGFGLLGGPGGRGWRCAGTRGTPAVWFRVLRVGNCIFDFWFRVLGFGIRVSVLGLRLPGSEFRVPAFVPQISGSVVRISVPGFGMSRGRRFRRARGGLRSRPQTTPRGSPVRGLVFKAHRWLYHSTLGSRVIKKKEEDNLLKITPRRSSKPTRMTPKPAENQLKFTISPQQREVEFSRSNDATWL